MTVRFVAGAVTLIVGAVGAAVATTRGRRLGATARQGARTGAIEVSRWVVDDVVERSLREFTPCGVDNAQLRPPRRLAAVKFIPARDAATGKHRGVMVFMEARPGHEDGGGYVHGHAAMALTPSGDIEQQIVLKPRFTCAWPQTWKDELRSAMTHELAHASDPARFERLRQGRARGSRQDNQTPEGYAAYVNTEVEVVANLAAAQAELLQDGRPTDLIEMPPAFNLRAYSKTWHAVADQLTPANRQRFYRMAARVRDVVAAERDVGRRAAEATWRKRLLVEHVTKHRRARRRA